MKIVVVGAGYAGTLAANRIAKRVKDAEITVINPRAHFVERVRLHQRLVGTATAMAPLSSMLRDGIESRVSTVEKIGDGTVVLEKGERIDFDHAILAVGSTTKPMPGTVPIGSWDGAERARTALAELPAGSTVTVIGAGPTGIETAAEVAEARPDVRVRLVGSPIGGTLYDRARQRVRDGLARLKVELVDDMVTEVAPGSGEYEGEVLLRSGRSLPSDLTLWAIVSGVPALAADSGLEVDADGRVVVDEFLRSATDERIFAVGDCAAVPGARFACQSAGPQAAQAANSIARRAGGRALKPYAVRYVSLCISLGRGDAVLQPTRRDDSPLRTYLAGRTAVVLKETACRGGKYGARTGLGVGAK